MKRIVRPTLAQQLEAFRLIDQIFEQLASGEVETLDGITCFRDLAHSAHAWYTIPDALDGWLRLWRRLIARYRLVIDLHPVERIAFLLAANTAFEPEDVAAAQRAIAHCRAAYRAMDVSIVGAMRDVVITSLRAETTEGAHS